MFNTFLFPKLVQFTR